MRQLVLASYFTFGTALLSSYANAAGCGQITIASMNWQSAEVAAEVDKFILSEGYGCDAGIVQGDTIPTTTSMAEKGQPDIAPEVWVDMLPDVVKNEINKGKLVQASPILSDGGENGWWIPKYIADAHPDIKTIADVFKHPELFADPDNVGKGAVYNGPQGWAGTVITGQLFKAYEGEKAGFRLIDTGSAAGLEGSMSKAYERKKGWVGFYWSPTSLLGKYPMVKLDHGAPFDPDNWKNCITVSSCPNPKPSAWAKDHVYTLLSKTLAQRAPGEVTDYLNKRSWKNDTVSQLMAWMSENQATGEEGAKYFLKKNPDLWSQWVSEDAAKKIRAAL